ncbi:MAG: MBOAT family protein, partial [Kiritimatiellae bacterium]|nr:MBOAT family protein [Kiritimatiellia bacterium]
LLGGLWHGARWNFVIWGGLHGLFLAVHKWFLVRAGRKVGAAPLPFTATGLLATAGTFLLVAFAWIFFRAQTFADAASCIAGIATLRGGLAAFPAGLAAKVAVFAALTAFLDLPAYRRDTQEALLGWPWLLRGAAYAAMFLLIILLRPLDDVPFIYFQF